MVLTPFANDKRRKLGLAEFFANKKQWGFLKSTEVGGRQGVKERELEWQ